VGPVSPANSRVQTARVATKRTIVHMDTTSTGPDPPNGSAGRAPSSAPGAPAGKRRGWSSGYGQRHSIAASKPSTGRKYAPPTFPPLVLACAAWGTAADALPFLDPPPAAGARERAIIGRSNRLIS